jgi:hydroxyacylglutathione hydrolase
MSAERSSTIGYERESNEALAFHDAQEFVLVSASVSTPRPPTTERVVALNRGPWLARPEDPVELDEAGEATVLDVRPFEAHASGHIPGAINVPVDGGSFGTKAGFVLTEGERVALHASSDEEALRAARGLWAVGILELDGYVLHPHAPETLATVDPEELKALLEAARVQVVDVREASERDGGYLPGTTNIPYRLMRKIGAGALQRDKPVVTVCESGARATIAASLLQRDGFDVRPVAGGGIADLTGDVVSFRRCGG